MVYLRFFRRVRIFPNFYLNICKRGISLSFVSRIIRLTFGKHGTRLTSGIRGTGLSFTEFIKHKNNNYGK